MERFTSNWKEIAAKLTTNLEHISDSWFCLQNCHNTWDYDCIAYLAPWFCLQNCHGIWDYDFIAYLEPRFCLQNLQILWDYISHFCVHDKDHKHRNYFLWQWERIILRIIWIHIINMNYKICQGDENSASNQCRKESTNSFQT